MYCPSEEQTTGGAHETTTSNEVVEKLDTDQTEGSNIPDEGDPFQNQRITRGCKSLLL